MTDPTSRSILNQIAHGPPLRALGIIGIGAKGEMAFALSPGISKADAALLLLQFETMVKAVHFPPPMFNAPAPSAANDPQGGKH